MHESETYPTTSTSPIQFNSSHLIFHHKPGTQQHARLPYPAHPSNARPNRKPLSPLFPLPPPFQIPPLLHQMNMLLSAPTPFFYLSVDICLAAFVSGGEGTTMALGERGRWNGMIRYWHDLFD